MRIAITVALALWSLAAQAQQDLSYHFGYALQAAMICPSLQLRVDTEQKVNEKYGSDIRQGDYYMAGLSTVIDSGNGVCQIAWNNYGCNGSVEPRLIQTSAQSATTSLCQY